MSIAADGLADERTLAEGALASFFAQLTLPVSFITLLHYVQIDYPLGAWPRTRAPACLACNGANRMSRHSRDENIIMREECGTKCS